MLVYRLECSCCGKGWYSAVVDTAIRPSGTTRNAYCPVWQDDGGEAVNVETTYRRFAFKRLCDLYAWFNVWPQNGDNRDSLLTLAVYDARVVWHAEHQVQFDIRFAERVAVYPTKKAQSDANI